MRRVVARLWWLPAVAAAAACAVRDRDALPGDVVYFAHAGERLFTSDAIQVFADAKLQAGPLQIAFLGALSKIADGTGVPLKPLLALVIELGAAAACLLVLRRLVRGRTAHPGPVLAAAGLAVLAVGLPQAAWLDGHPAQLAIPLLWIVAGLDAREGRMVRAGVVVGLSGGLELWGVLGVCVLLLGPSARGAARALGLAAVVFVAPLAPFMLFGDFRMFEYDWVVTAGRPLAGLLEPGSPFGWPLRVAQAAASIGAAAAVAYLLRRRPEALWAVPLAAVAVRLLIDPLVYAAYWLGPLTLLTVGAVDVATGDLPRRALAARRARLAAGA